MKKIIVFLFALCTTSVFAMQNEIKKQGSFSKLMPGHGLQLSEDRKSIVARQKNDFDETVVRFDLQKEKFTLECATYASCACGLFYRRQDKKVEKELRERIHAFFKQFQIEMIRELIDLGNIGDVENWLWSF